MLLLKWLPIRHGVGEEGVEAVVDGQAGRGGLMLPGVEPPSLRRELVRRRVRTSCTSVSTTVRWMMETTSPHRGEPVLSFIGVHSTARSRAIGRKNIIVE